MKVCEIRVAVKDNNDQIHQLISMLNSDDHIQGMMVVNTNPAEVKFNLQTGIESDMAQHIGKLLINIKPYISGVTGLLVQDKASGEPGLHADRD